MYDICVEDNRKTIVNQLKKYDILNLFKNKDEMIIWITELNELQINNFLNLNINPEKIKFDSKLLIDKNLLNQLDYIKKVNAIASIDNAEGCYHLFEYLIREEFLESEKFYQDIETLKKMESARTGLWIIGDPVFINSPYHDEDFELLATVKDTSDKKFDYVVCDAIATVAGNIDSIKSEYHRQDLQTIVKYGSDALQLSHSYPERCINYLATNPVSLNDNYHLENMEILAQNVDIGNFLYAVMTDKKTIKKDNYRRIIREMIDNKNNKAYVFLVCYYAVGADKAKTAQNILEHNYFYEINESYDIKKLIEKVDEKINIVNGDFKETDNYEIECNDSVNPMSKTKKLIKKIFKKQCK